MIINSIKRFNITKVSGAVVADTSDALAIEEPLEIRLEYGPAGERQVKNVSVTMRTPGNDAELAAGFLFTEGIIPSCEAIVNIAHCFINCMENKENVIVVKLKDGIVPNLHNSERNFYTSSSCGVCGKGSIDAIRTVSSFANKREMPHSIDAEVLYRLPDVLRYYQDAFASTGGIHASGLFNLQGELMLLREDVGRHNALDKLIGAAINQNWLPLDNHVLLLSGRASFELVQKAAMAGITIIAAVGAPSSLAVELAEEFNITLAGFLRNQRFNIYTAANRILLPANENTY
ncbi:formate dehydrogenase accessory sulfurtransferase FdhD [Mucilaginibacter sp.]|uniref:formate dehydrogenase accessory sulfurtransferase FdhD n=1 Tax=Mucilaginibacter sp. TaxID=1882438 RepID=UPI0028406501|nr:formate dehydrogenase accessory sulfurtransferase FdhD [Mucilaginibacter sp.]MDR3693832.1 formate dehydrogenase accessory sulfurtransferase FdhD [Mucilaginibacter sp.]